MTSNQSNNGKIKAPLIAHVIFHLDVGGLENGLVNIINRTPADKYRHAVICLTYATAFRERIRVKDVPLYELRKREGHDLGMYFRLWRLFRQLSPVIVHTRNIAALESVVLAAAAGVGYRIHGEHGRDMTDLTGDNPRYVWLRRCLQPFVQRYIPMSADLEHWLTTRIGIPTAKLRQIYNGVDTERFSLPQNGRQSLPVGGDFAARETFVVGSIGRMDAVKDQLTLVKAFIDLINSVPDGRKRLRLVHIGDGELREPALEMLGAAGVQRYAWFPGMREDVSELMRGFDVFVLPSLAEGISNTILEAMATGLPVVATNVGGNAELVIQDQTGLLVPPADPPAMGEAIATYFDAPDLARRHGNAGRARVEQTFSIERMVEQYLSVYDELLDRRPV